MAARSRRRGSKDLPDEEPGEPASSPALQEAAPAAAADSSLRGAADVEVVAGDPSVLPSPPRAQDDPSPRSALAQRSRPEKPSKDSTTSSELRFQAERRKSSERPSKDSVTSSDRASRRKLSEKPTKDSTTSSDRRSGSGSGSGRGSGRVSGSGTKESNTSSDSRRQSQLALRTPSKSKESATSSELREQARPGSSSKAHGVNFELDDEQCDLSGSEASFGSHNSQQKERHVAIMDEVSDVSYESDTQVDVADEPVVELLEDTYKQDLHGMVQMNSHAMLAFLCFAVLWVSSACALLLALTWHYVWVEVEMLADRAAQSAVEHGNFHASEVLSPATSVMKTLDLGFRGGAIKSISDYVGFYKVLEPFFQALPELREVEMADTPEYFRQGPGSVLATRLPNNGIELRSDRGDCALVPGGRGCTLASHRANGTSWFQDRVGTVPHPWNPLPMFLAWDGPSFARDSPHEAVCDEVCWSPIYSLASRISGGTDPYFALDNKSFDPVNSVVVRVTMEAVIFIDVVKQIQMRSRGEAFICTDQGRVVAAVEMADVLKADVVSGSVEMVAANEFPRPWAAEVDLGSVEKGDGTSKLVLDGEYLVSAWRMESPHNATATLGESLRIVVAIPSQVYADSVLTSLRLWFIAVSAMPVAFILVAVIFNLYHRCARKHRKELKDMTIAELQAITAAKKELIRLDKERRKAAAEEDKLRLGHLRRTATLGRLGSIIRLKSVSWGTSRGSMSLEDGSDELPTSKSGRLTSFFSSLRKSRATSPPALADRESSSAIAHLKPGAMLSHEGSADLEDNEDNDVQDILPAALEDKEDDSAAEDLQVAVPRHQGRHLH